MFFLPSKETPILCQGITSSSGAVHTELALAYGSHIVAGVSAEKNVKTFLNIPVYHSVQEVMQKASEKPKVSVIFSTPSQALKDAGEAIEARIPMIVCTTEGVPMHDALKMRELAEKNGVCFVGPSSSGIVCVGETLIGSMPAHLFSKGKISVVGRSSSLMWEAVEQLKQVGLGVATCVSLGADHLIATTFVPVVKALLKDKETQSILVLGQVHGELEYELAEFYKKQKEPKKMWAYIPGRSLEKSDKRPLLGMQTVKFADVIDAKKQTLIDAGVYWIERPDLIGQTIKKQVRIKK
ncbi:MAG: succinate--CoA ligase subunit alpha [Alphaproteobacteria bacterium]|nr:succinate--CoA ligase subunit alpha [Alphaproteobacteria bacterium]